MTRALVIPLVLAAIGCERPKPQARRASDAAPAEDSVRILVEGDRLTVTAHGERQAIDDVSGTLQVDKDTRGVVVNRVIRSTRNAGIAGILFAVKSP